jgi:hypothetical protein
MYDMCLNICFFLQSRRWCEHVRHCLLRAQDDGPHQDQRHLGHHSPHCQSSTGTRNPQTLIHSDPSIRLHFDTFVDKAFL